MIFQMESLKHYFTEEITSAERKKCSVLSAVVFFLLGNGYAYFNHFPIHDAIIFSQHVSYSWQISLGRFLLPVYLQIRGPVPAPLVILCLSLIYLSLSEYIVVRILDLKQRLSVILVTAFLSVNVFTLEISTVHQYYADVFLVALLFACLAVYILEAEISIRTRMTSLLCFFISFGIYPAFITFALCMFALIILRTVTDGKAKELKDKIPVWLISTTSAGMAYVAVSRIILLVLHIKPSKVNWSMFSVGRLSPAEILNSVMKQYIHFAALFFEGSLFHGRSAGVSAILILILSFSAFMAFSRRSAKIVTLSFLLLFPFCSRMVNIMTENTRVYRTIYAQFLILPVMIWMFFAGVKNIRDIRKKEALIILVTALSLFNIYKNIAYTNGAFIWQRILYQRTAYHMGQVLSDIKTRTDGEMNMPVAVIGLFDLETCDEFDYEKYRRIEGFGPDTGITYERLFYEYASFLGYNLNWKSDYADKVRNKTEVKSMPHYPSDGYLAEVDGYLVVKLSEEGLAE